MEKRTCKLDKQFCNGHYAAAVAKRRGGRKFQGLLGRAVQQHRSNVTNRLCWVQTLRTHIDAILNAMASKNTEGIIKLRQPIFSRGITTVRQEAVGLQQAGRADKSIWVPPERWAAR